MNESLQLLPNKLRWILIGTLTLIATLLVLALLIPAPGAIASAPTETSSPSDGALNSYDSSNVVTTGMGMAGDEFSKAMESTGRAANATRRNFTTNISRGSKATAHGLHSSATFIGSGIASGATFVGHGATSGAVFAGRAIGSTASAVTYVPRTVVGLAADTAIVSAVIKPADDMPVPTIDTSLPTTLAEHIALPDAKTVAHITTETDTEASWPIHGAITTYFGVPHWPYQATHTGIDISDGLPSGTTAIKPFKPGRVVDTIRSSSGLGNHIVVDHGGGITSVYGHLYAISVEPGQVVDKTTTLGFEGSTGASTGTHLHFEIIVNGQAMDPLQFVTGRP